MYEIIFRLCLHQRDFNPATPLYDSVTVATESSAKTIIMLSRSYLQTVWPIIGQLFSLAVLLLFSSSPLALFLLFSYSSSTLLLPFCCSSLAVLMLFSCCSLAVLLLFFRCSLAVLLLFSCCSPPLL